MAGAGIQIFRDPKIVEAMLRESLRHAPGVAESAGPSNLEKIAGFFVSPLAVLGGLRKKKRVGPTLPVTFDEATGQALVSWPVGGGRDVQINAAKQIAAEKLAAELTVLANQTVQSGKVAPGTPLALLDQFGELANIGRLRISNPPGSVETNFGGPIAGYRREFVSPIIPTGANSGWLTQTPAAKALLASLGSRSSTRKKRASGSRSRRARKTSMKKGMRRAARSGMPRKRKRSAARLKKGSAAAKRFMARLRRMRKK